MADSLYEPKVYRRQGGDALVVKSGGKVVIQGGGYITPSGESVAATIDALATGLQTSVAGNGVTTINAIVAALKGVGILATS